MKSVSRRRSSESGRSFPVNEPPNPNPSSPPTKKVMEGGYGTVKSTRPRESAVVKQSRAKLIQRLGILPRKSK